MAGAGIELNLPDLPEVPIRLGPDGDAAQPQHRRVRQPWPLRLREVITAYLPLLMMVLLALGSWWLVKNSPQPPSPKTTRLASGEPDYTMRGFTVQRFGREGQLRLTLEGRELHHYPDTDRIEIAELKLIALAPDGRQVLATARQALSNGRGTEVQLRGGAQLRSRTADGQPVEIDSEFLQVFTETERVVTDRAVRLRMGTTQATAGGLVWDNRERVLELKPPIRAVLQLRATSEGVER
jgi:lipopolysaccharide export system protein LptC